MSDVTHPLDTGELSEVRTAEELPALNEAPAELKELNPRHAKLVELCFFVGLTQKEAAETLGISVATAERNWAFCRTWLYLRMNDTDRPSPEPAEGNRAK